MNYTSKQKMPTPKVQKSLKTSAKKSKQKTAKQATVITATYAKLKAKALMYGITLTRNKIPRSAKELATAIRYKTTKKSITNNRLNR